MSAACPPDRLTRRAVVAFLLVAALGRPDPAAAQEPGERAGEAAGDALLRQAVAQSRSMLEQWMLAEKVPGASVAVLVDDALVWSEGIGFSDVENSVPMWPHTRMRVGSVAKAMTAVALARLIEAGRLDLDAPVQEYVPYFPEKRYPITSRQLAGHLAGIRHYRGDEFLSREHFESVREGLAFFADDSLLFEPGTRFSYSSYGFNLLSAVVEGASGTPFLEYMQENVFDPLGMVRTVADHPDRLISARGDYYALDEERRLVNAPYVDNSYKWAGGGFLSTAEDLVRFGHGLLRSDLLAPETRALLFTTQRTRAGEATGYGIGFQVGADPAGRRRVGHGGGSVGGTTALAMYPEQGLVLALIANLSGADYGDLPDRIAATFLDALGR